LTRPVPKIFVTRFFQLITSRQFAEAERVLERIKQKMHPSDRNRGYFQALYGMLLTHRNNDDRYAFLSTLDLNDKKHLKRYRHEFMSHVESRLHAEYDRGYFEAWAEYMKVLPKLEVSITPSINNSSVKREEAQMEARPQEAKTEIELANEQPESVPKVDTKSGRQQQSVEPQRTLTEFAR